ncbi:MAG: hypothetical protein NTV39_03620 [Candidatus Saccharibacteria bacterium]|nr:hypothetical protein [Candidatus Saccharibacteria bacterium]
MKRRTNQGGSVANFVVIGVILAVGLLASIYFLNQRAQQARKDQSISATSTKTQTPKHETSNTTTTTNTTNTSTKTSNSTTKSQTSNLPATGAETSIISIVSVFLLSASVVAYMTSRRAAQNSL